MEKDGVMLGFIISTLFWVAAMAVVFVLEIIKKVFQGGIIMKKGVTNCIDYFIFGKNGVKTINSKVATKKTVNSIWAFFNPNMKKSLRQLKTEAIKEMACKKR